ncbi:hypothetical protein J6590_068821 [Homalodisca vitripennis]|nr:hypothetical protein J6590_068821 [Homalodisca vitripennis]
MENWQFPDVVAMAELGLERSNFSRNGIGAGLVQQEPGEEQSNFNRNLERSRVTSTGTGIGAELLQQEPG